MVKTNSNKYTDVFLTDTQEVKDVCPLSDFLNESIFILRKEYLFLSLDSEELLASMFYYKGIN